MVDNVCRDVAEQDCQQVMMIMMTRYKDGIAVMMMLMATMMMMTMMMTMTIMMTMLKTMMMTFYSAGRGACATASGKEMVSGCHR